MKCSCLHIIITQQKTQWWINTNTALETLNGSTGFSLAFSYRFSWENNTTTKSLNKCSIFVRLTTFVFYLFHYQRWKWGGGARRNCNKVNHKNL